MTRSGDSKLDVPRDQIFDVLSNERRQRVLQYLKQQDGNQVKLRELVDYVAAQENSKSVADLNSNERKRVYTALRQQHLPKLDDTGVIRYERQRGEIELTDSTETAQMYLEYVPHDDIPWSHFYLGLSIICAALGALISFEVALFADVPSMAFTGLVVVLFSVSALVHTMHVRRSRFDAPISVDEI